MAARSRRYLGLELGDRYVENTRGAVENVLFRMRPERWLTVDYSDEEPLNLTAR